MSWRSKIYAIIETGGKQYRVTPGQTIAVEKLDVAEGNTIELDRVLLIADGDKITVGKPTVDGVKVLATAQGEAKGKKVIGLKYKAKTRYRRRVGHRQIHTRLAIDKIVIPEEAASEPVKKVRRRKEEVKTDGA